MYLRRFIPTSRVLGRHVVHDPRSRGFALPVAVDRSAWYSRTLRVYDPIPNPNQVHGNCTGVSKCVMFNTAGNRRTGLVLDMDDADRFYSLATTLDPWEGSWRPDDTGSSGLAAAQAAQRLGWGGEYRWLFGGADEVVSTVVGGRPVSVGTAWYDSMFYPDLAGVVHIGGQIAGGHQWTARGYDKARDQIIGRCWWGTFRDFRISRADLDTLLADDGDAHTQEVLR